MFIKRIKVGLLTVVALTIFYAFDFHCNSHKIFDWTWGQSLSITAIIIAIWVARWQVKRTIREQEKQSLAEQRYDILTELFDLSPYIATINSIVSGENTSINQTIVLNEYKEKISQKIKRIFHLIYKPTIMPDDQIERIIRAIIFPDSVRPTKISLAPINEVIIELKNQLKPSITELLSNIRKQADKGEI